MPSDNASLTSPVAPQPQPLDPVAGVLSYLIPGLGQVYQGRMGKGVLFFVCIYTLFFYGMFLGTGTVHANGKSFTVSSNVYLPAVSNPQNNTSSLPRLAVDLYNRPQFIGQFWVGIAAWPALLQYSQLTEANADAGHPLLGYYMRTPSIEALNAVHTCGDKRLELGWVFTVIAGVLNIMIIYDAVAGPAFLLQPSLASPKSEKAVT